MTSPSTWRGCSTGTVRFGICWLIGNNMGRGGGGSGQAAQSWTASLGYRKHA
jgi:hypothetical protein